VIVFVLFTLIGTGVADIGTELAYAVGKRRLQFHRKRRRPADRAAFKVQFNAQRHHLHVGFPQAGSRAMIAGGRAVEAGPDAFFIRIIHSLIFEFRLNYPANEKSRFESMVTGRQLRAIGFPQGPVIPLAIRVMSEHYGHYGLQEQLSLLRQVLENPSHYVEDLHLDLLAKELLAPAKADSDEIPLLHSPVPFHIFGAEHIEQGALDQMHTASKLPVAVAGALMPDAHQGYGLPIGGVLAADNAVIPYGVGVDIGCRMCLSVFDLDPVELDSRTAFFSRELNEATLFGAGGEFKKPSDHPVLEDRRFDELQLLKGLQDRAWRQLGTSGSGNHFAEFGAVEILAKDDTLSLAPGRYLGFLTHSGSRALGANVANHFTKLARESRRLPGQAAHLSWFGLEEEAGQMYWIAMNLAGDYASANHEVMHAKIARQLGRSPLRRVENHHNFAWKENIDGRELIVHRKGATPAASGVLGIIPGSMTAPGYIVKGKGDPLSLHSASHGAGRKMSRTQAIKALTASQLKEELARHGVTLLGGGLDEAPFAYKDIGVVMQAQQELVDTLGLFHPRIVKMDRAGAGRGRKRVLGE
jgi:tRNA-splicing ligase RtcB